MNDLFGGNNLVGYDPDDVPGRSGFSFNQLKKLVECNPVEGWAKWKVDRVDAYGILRAEAGDYLKDRTSAGRLSHVIWVFHTNGRWAEDELDHKDRDHSNNKIGNLREATSQQNKMNQGVRSNNKSGVTGVCWYPAYSKWNAQIKMDGKCINLGYFIDFDDAVAARYKAEDEYFGEFAARHSRPPRPPMKDLFAA